MIKKLKSWFVIEEPSDEKSPSNPSPKKSTPTKSKSTPPPAPTTTIKGSSDGKVTTQFVDVLLKSLSDNNLEGFDYFEYKESLKSLEKMPMDEATRYQSAFAMAKTMGATPAKLVQAANHYLKVLANEDAKFQQAVKGQTTKQISEKNQRIKDLAATIEQKEKRVKQLQQEMKAHLDEMKKAKASIQSASSKVEATKNNFMTTYKSIYNQIVLDIENMKKYLK